MFHRFLLIHISIFTFTFRTRVFFPTSCWAFRRLIVEPETA
ncbi:hypothetical protein HOLDEFILI_00092 [Holdemania filiformis DSM 12042]|uniref:Uncharacterized protein n=1 Tax=Holdemania filiformis DSM 12042 TaxID=545696 RepID=B9Y2R8_9FIRM|nr:hypothetical protein HOLDEFILI_00092 [Holdemania filiformis DSM 12042]